MTITYIYKFITAMGLYLGYDLLSRGIYKLESLCTLYLTDIIVNTKSFLSIIKIFKKYTYLYCFLCKLYPKHMCILTSVYVSMLISVLYSNNPYIFAALVIFTISSLALVYITYIDEAFAERHPSLFIWLLIILSVIVLLSFIFFVIFTVVKINPINSPPGSNGPSGGSSNGPSGGPNKNPQPEQEISAANTQETKEERKKIQQREKREIMATWAIKKREKAQERRQIKIKLSKEELNKRRRDANRSNFEKRETERKCNLEYYNNNNLEINNKI